MRRDSRGRRFTRTSSAPRSAGRSSTTRPSSSPITRAPGRPRRARQLDPRRAAGRSCAAGDFSKVRRDDLRSQHAPARSERRRDRDSASRQHHPAGSPQSDSRRDGAARAAAELRRARRAGAQLFLPARAVLEHRPGRYSRRPDDFRKEQSLRPLFDQRRTRSPAVGSFPGLHRRRHVVASTTAEQAVLSDIHIFLSVPGE